MTRCSRRAGSPWEPPSGALESAPAHGRRGATSRSCRLPPFVLAVRSNARRLADQRASPVPGSEPVAARGPPRLPGRDRRNNGTCRDVGDRWRRTRRAGSEAQVAEARVIVRPPAERPVVLTIGCRDREVVDAGETHAHEPLVVELPVLVAVGPEVLAAVVSPL